MLKVTVDFQNNFDKESKKIRKQLNQLPKESHQKFVDLTPRKTGNAKRSTVLKNNTIEANYAYAQRLDQGYSKQAPNGMTKPFDKWLENKFKNIFGK